MSTPAENVVNGDLLRESEVILFVIKLRVLSSIFRSFDVIGPNLDLWMYPFQSLIAKLEFIIEK